MSSTNITFSGSENLKKIFADFPEKAYRKAINTAFVKAAVPVKRSMVACLPPNLSSLSRAIKAKSARASKGEPSLAVGVYSSGGLSYINSRGIKWNPWVMAYWHNYGTMSWRTTLSRLHRFKTPRKRKTASWNGGIKPLFFIERGWDRSKAQAQQTFEDSADKEITKFFEKEAKK